jgi:hypothetical protein
VGTCHAAALGLAALATCAACQRSTSGSSSRDAPADAAPVAIDPVAPPAADPRASHRCAPVDPAKVARFAVDTSIVDVAVPPIVDPAAALAGFHARVARLARGNATDHVRIAMFGDSNLTADATTGRLRRQLQARFGDGGHGYVALSRPWEWYSHNDVHHDGTWKSWKQIATSTNKVMDAHYGFANIAAECAVPGCSSWVSTDPRPGAPIGWTASRFDLFFLQQPGGGSFDVAIDGSVVRSIDTRAPSFEAAFERFDLPDAHHELKVLVRGHGPVRMYGVALERAQPSIVVDSLGTGSLNFEQLTIVKNDTRRAQLQRRNYDLVIIQLGTNVWGTDTENKRNAKLFVDELRGALPDVPILFVSSPDSMEDAVPGAPPAKHSDARVVKMAKTVRVIAEESRAAFWDWHAAMGGADSILAFAKKGLVEPDRVHLKKSGDELMADRMLSALWDDVATYVDAHPTAGCDTTPAPAAAASPAATSVASAAPSASTTTASKTPAK